MNRQCWEWERFLRDWQPCEVHSFERWPPDTRQLEPQDCVLIATHTPLPPGRDTWRSHIWSIANQCSRVTVILDKLESREYEAVTSAALPPQVTVFAILGPNSSFWSAFTQAWIQYGSNTLTEVQIWLLVIDELSRYRCKYQLMSFVSEANTPQSRRFLR